MQQGQVITIGVAGGSASGKSTIAEAIVENVGSANLAHILHDWYYKPLEELEQVQHPNNLNFDHPGALDTGLLIQHLHQLRAWKSVEAPVYDFVAFQRLPQTQQLDPRPVILVEGILVLAEPALRELLDIRIFVDTPADVRFIRRLRRDTQERGRTVESVIEQYLSTVRPMHQAFVEPSKLHADVIIPQGGYNQVAIDMVADRVKSILQGAALPPSLLERVSGAGSA
ncbi:MAG: uridine kinase [Anaerolineae bacterium]|nr:uridine kinase [Anaerolineae bacterium]